MARGKRREEGVKGMKKLSCVHSASLDLKGTLTEMYMTGGKMTIKLQAVSACI